MIEVQSGGPVLKLNEAVLFAFDDHAFPFRRHLSTHLVPAQFPGGKGRGNIVLPHGPPGSHDEGVHFYGTIRQIGDTLHMWYIGRQGESKAINREGGIGRICYATSTDGVHWTKPELGLVEHNGSKGNNLIRLNGGIEETCIDSGTVLHDPGEPDPARRFKMVYQATGGAPRPPMRVAFSADGLDWYPSKRNPVGPYLEWCGSMQRGGLFYVNGQMGEMNEPAPGKVRRLYTLCSADFETWSPCAALGLNRSPTHTEPQWEGQRNLWEEIHLGAGLWDRGNVVLAFYGMWHGHPTGDRRHVAIDLGFAISHDGLHYQEPIPSFAMLPAAEEWDHPPGWAPALQQGQAFANIGDRTCHWYSCWRHVGQVRLATWERDRLGYVEMFRPRARSECVTCPFQHEGSGTLFVNAEILSSQAWLELELLDEGFRPISGYGNEQCAKVSQSGLRVPVAWRDGTALPASKSPLRVRFRFVGGRPEDNRLYACYIAA